MPFVINGLALINFYFVLINLKGIDYGENADLAPIAFAVYITFVLTVSSVALFFTKFIKNKNSRKMYAACVTLSAMSFDEAAALVNVLLMKYYNGEKGRKIGWIFYLFYPLHFLILAGICKLLGFY
jgi:heme/copper-type cytochrome/quinol oxidase subunit 3